MAGCTLVAWLYAIDCEIFSKVWCPDLFDTLLPRFCYYTGNGLIPRHISAEGIFAPANLFSHLLWQSRYWYTGKYEYPLHPLCASLVKPNGCGTTLDLMLLLYLLHVHCTYTIAHVLCLIEASECTCMYVCALIHVQQMWAVDFSSSSFFACTSCCLLLPYMYMYTCRHSIHVYYHTCSLFLYFTGSLISPKVVKSVHYCPATKKTIERKYSDLTSLEPFPVSAIYPTRVRSYCFTFHDKAMYTV